MKLGIDHLLTSPERLEALGNHRVALLGHPASTTETLHHSLDALIRAGVNISAAFGPQHGMRGDKQDNMVESANEFDSVHAIPVFSLYGETRRPTESMMTHFDLLLVDIQDVGCRIYTFITTLCYLLEACAAADKPLWVLDRPNPAGRVIEGALLQPGQESFVGVAPIPMRHGMTLGEAARWYVDYKKLDIELEVIAMEAYDPTEGGGFGWPVNQLSWVNPSPNLATLNSARAYAGTVLLEGTTLSEGRGTTRPLELFGAPGLDCAALLKRMEQLAPQWLEGCRIRPCWFEPTFHKHVGQLCAGFQLHTDYPDYDPNAFKPYRLITLFLKVLRQLNPEYPIWRDFAYEYVTDRLAIDVIDGGSGLREWVDDSAAEVGDLEQRLLLDEARWLDSSSAYYLY